MLHLPETDGEPRTLSFLNSEFLVSTSAASEVLPNILPASARFALHGLHPMINAVVNRDGRLHAPADLDFPAMYDRRPAPGFNSQDRGEVFPSYIPMLEIEKAEPSISFLLQAVRQYAKEKSRTNPRGRT